MSKASKKSKEEAPSPSPLCSFPSSFEETFSVRKPFGARIRKQDCRITNLEPSSSLSGKAFVGDAITAIDGSSIKTIKQLHNKLSEAPDKVSVRIQHGNWSYCKHRCTTVEKIQMDKDNEKVTGRAIDIYYVVLNVFNCSELPVTQLGLNVKYDARERLQISSVDAHSLASVHLRPNDIIREVNDRVISSKAMLKYHLMEGILKDGKIRLLVECPAGGSDSYRDTVEMASDVIDIAAKQIERFKKNMALVPEKNCISTKPSNKRVGYAKIERTEVEIVADCDPSKLKPCKNSK